MSNEETGKDNNGPSAMNSQTLLSEVHDFCRRVGMAESTFGRLAVNDGKLVTRLRTGGRVTIETVNKVQSFMRQPLPNRSLAPTRRKQGITTSIMTSEVNLSGASIEAAAAPQPAVQAPAAQPPALSGSGPSSPAPGIDPEQNFRFYDNRQKYLMFVNTCSEKRVVSERISLELGNIHPRPPAIRLFDAGVGDGTVLTRVMRAMHQRFENLPFYIVGKEISLEDVRLTLEKAADRFYEHPATVLVLTNLYYSEAPYLSPASAQAASQLVWHEVALRGRTAAEYEQQINDLEPFLAQHWKASVSKKSGNPIYERPVVLVLYLENSKFVLNQVIPKRGAITADYDMIIASQPYRARATPEFKAKKVVAPLSMALAPGGRLVGIHSCGDDPGLEIVQQVWPGEQPFSNNDRREILQHTKAAMGAKARYFNFNAYSDERSKFKYQMYTLPNEIDAESTSIGTSTLFAAWNNANYVAQIEDERLTHAMADDRYLEKTKAVLRKHNGLWFWDETYVISRKREI